MAAWKRQAKADEEADSAAGSGAAVNRLGISQEATLATNKDHRRISSITKSAMAFSTLSSRRSSVRSSISETSRPRSVLSIDGGLLAQPPILQGNLQLLNVLECGDRVVSITFADDPQYIVGGLMNGQIKVFSSVFGNLLNILENEEISLNRMPVSRIRAKPAVDQNMPNCLAATYVSGHLRIWNIETGSCMGQVQDENPEAEYLCLSHNPYADVIAVGMDNGHVKLYDERTLQVTSLLKKSISTSKVDGHTDRVFAIANHPSNPHEFVSSGWDNTLQFWDARAPNAVRSVYGVFVCGEGLAFDRKGRELLVASWRPWRNLQILDYNKGCILAEVEPELQPHYLTAGSYFPGNKDYFVAVGTDKGIAKVVNRHKKVTVASFRDANPSSSGGGGIYSVSVPKRPLPNQIAPSAVQTGFSFNQRFAISNRSTVVLMDFSA